MIGVPRSAHNPGPMAESLTKSESPRLFLLDAMALAYRAHFAFIATAATYQIATMTATTVRMGKSDLMSLPQSS